MKTSPTQRSLKLLRDRGCTCAIVEKWNPHARLKQDLFGFIDILAIEPARTYAIQTTTVANAAAREKKIRESPYFEKVIAAGWLIVVHSWAKRGGRGERKVWTCKEVGVAP